VDKIEVLIVDDSPAVRDGLQGILRAHPDIEVVGEAVDGLEAIAKAEQLHPSVILMDAQMPQMDGTEATRRIKDRLPDVKILFLTVHPAHIEEALAAGADGYLMKDCARQELLEEIRKLGRQE
jgi:DNA-binding NarL/FixJ family response regulator